MHILHSLKMGGSVHYAPALPFLEKYLDNKFDRIKDKELKAQEVKSVTIKRLI